MDELVFKSKKGSPVTTSLLVAEKFEKRHSDILRAIESIIHQTPKYQSERNFALSEYRDASGKANPMYIMTKDGFSVLVMGFTGERAMRFKWDFINAFNKMEEALKKQSIALPSYAEALRALADKVEENEALKAKAAQDSPKIEYFEKTIEANNLVDIGQSAKLLKLPYGRNTLFKLLRDKGILFKGRNEPKQEYCERGYFQLKNELIERNSHPSFMITKVLVTQKGLYWLSKMFGGDYNPNLPTLNIQ